MLLPQVTSEIRVRGLLDASKATFALGESEGRLIFLSQRPAHVAGAEPEAHQLRPV